MPTARRLRREPGHLVAVALRPELVTGHPEIDAQHAALLADVVRLDEGADRVHLEVAVAFLRQHVLAHFHYEELLMQEYAFAGAAAHRAEHRAGLRRIDTLVTALAGEERAEDLAALVRFVRGWIAEHEQQFDLALVRHVREALAGG